MRDLVFVKANYIKQGFKKLGETRNPDTKDFSNATQHKIYIPQDRADNVRPNLKMLCAFLTIRVIGKDKLMTFGSGDEVKIALDIPVSRKDFKSGEQFGFQQAVVNFFRQYAPMEMMSKTHLTVSGVINHEKMFGIHYTVLVPEELETALRKSEMENGKTLSLADLKGKYRPKLSSVSAMCIDNYKEARKEEDNG